SVAKMAAYGSAHTRVCCICTKERQMCFRKRMASPAILFWAWSRIVKETSGWPQRKVSIAFGRTLLRRFQLSRVYQVQMHCRFSRPRTAAFGSARPTAWISGSRDKSLPLMGLEELRNLTENSTGSRQRHFFRTVTEESGWPQTMSLDTCRATASFPCPTFPAGVYLPSLKSPQGTCGLPIKALVSFIHSRGN